MQPPPRGRGPEGPPAGGAGSDDDPIVARIRAWARRPTVEDTLALCDELRRVPTVRGPHVDAVSRAIHQRHAKEPAVMVALGRLQLTVGKLSDAQQTFVAAGRLDPDARDPYRYLGEVLLRRGDAARAERMLEKAIEIESRSGDHGDPSEEPTTEWLVRAKQLHLVQDASGEGAVAAELSNILARQKKSANPPRGSLRPPLPIHAESDDEPTQAAQIPEQLRRRATPGFETRASSGPPIHKPAHKPALLPKPTPPPALKPRPTPPPLPPSQRPPALKRQSSIPPPLPALKPRVTPTQIAPPMFPAPRVTPAQIAITNASDLTTDSALTRLDVDEAGGVHVTTGDFLGSNHPTIRSTHDHESVPLLRSAPPSDHSPEPAPLRSNTGQLRALRAQSVTLGEPEPVRDERLSTKRVRPTPMLGAPAPTDPYNTDRVLSALAHAGVYEPAATAASPGQWMKTREIARPGRRGGWLYAVLAILVFGAIGGAIFGGRSYKEKQRREADEATLRAEADVRRGNLDALANAEKELGRAFELDSRTHRGARVWLEDRVLRSYVWPSEERREGGLASAIERAKAVGVPEGELAFARIALALSSDDTPSAAALAKTLDPGGAKEKNDAWRELAVGWVLERAGDARAADRYLNATKLDPSLVVARLALGKLAALAGDSERVEAITKDFSGELSATRDDLLGLAALIKTGTPGKGGAPEPRRPAGFGWIAPALAMANPAASIEDRKKEANRAATLARDPGDLTRVGRLAAAAGDEATASRAALRALEASPIFPPARALGARIALSVGRPDDAARALEGVTAEGDAEFAALRGWLAYERQELAQLKTALEDPSVPAEGLNRADLAPVVRPLRYALKPRGTGALSAKEKTELEALAALGELGPLVAFDVALGVFDLAFAESVAKKWGPDEGLGQRPARALRAARLARLQGRAADADRLSKIAVEQGTITPSALVERVLILGGTGKGAEALALLTRYPLLVTEEQPWLRAWATAQTGKMADAKKQVEALKEPEKKAPWAVRRDALLALSATNDKRAKTYAKDLVKERPQDPDVHAIAKSLAIVKE